MFAALCWSRRLFLEGVPNTGSALVELALEVGVSRRDTLRMHTHLAKVRCPL